MTDITPPRELVEKWVAEIWHEGTPVRVAASDPHIAARAATWGADQELDACCHYFARDLRESLALELRTARRPKPPSLKEQALALQAQAVLDAATSVCHPETEVVAFQCTRLEVAAALRAAADQVVPTKQNYSEAPHLLASACLNGMAYAANELRLIAAELEVSND